MFPHHIASYSIVITPLYTPSKIQKFNKLLNLFFFLDEGINRFVCVWKIVLLTYKYLHGVDINQRETSKGIIYHWALNDTSDKMTWNVTPAGKKKSCQIGDRKEEPLEDKKQDFL